MSKQKRREQSFREELFNAFSHGAGLCAWVLELCRKAGLVKLGRVATDGTKVRANASRHKATSYGRMKEAETKLQARLLLGRCQSFNCTPD